MNRVFHPISLCIWRSEEVDGNCGMVALISLSKLGPKNGFKLYTNFRYGAYVPKMAVVVIYDINSSVVYIYLHIIHYTRYFTIFVLRRNIIYVYNVSRLKTFQCSIKCHSRVGNDK